MVAFNPNWAAIAQILGGALAAPNGQYAQGAAQGAQNYQQFANARQDQQYRQQQMDLQRQEVEMRKAEFDRQAANDAQWANQIAMARQPVQVGPTRPDAPQGYQTATGQQRNPLFDGLSPTQLALLGLAGQKAGLPMLAQWHEPQEVDKGPAGVQEYEYAKSQGFTGTFLDYEKAKAEAGRAPQQPGANLTERQRNAAAAGLTPGSPEYQQYILGRDDTQPGPFQGTGLDAQSYNIVLEGDPATPQYAAAYAQLAMPKVQYDAVTGKSVVVQPDMSWARKHVGQNVPEPRSKDDRATVQTFPGATVTSDPGAAVYNETQGKAAGFADRIGAANTVLDSKSSAGTSQIQQGLSAVPNMLGGNYMISADRQQFEQAERDFINAILRRESGAVISPEEFANARLQYIPQPGDDQATQAQKKASRERALNAMQREGGPFYKPGGKKTIIDGIEIEELP